MLAPDVRFERFDVNKNQYPPSLAQVNGILITGSKSAAYDDEPWIHNLQAHIRELATTPLPVVGICFGHQVIHQALGGLVQKAPIGWCVGVHSNQLLEASPEYGQRGDCFRLLSSHQDQVVELAPGFVRLAQTERCPVAMTRLAHNFLTLQGHPEFTRDYALALMQRRIDSIGEPAYSQALASLDQSLDDQRVLKWMLSFLGVF